MKDRKQYKIMHAKHEISDLWISLTEITDTNTKLKLMDST